MTNYSQTLYLIRGLPGSGKSTYAQELVYDYGNKGSILEHFEADMYFISLLSKQELDEKGKYVFNPAYLKEAHAWCRNRTYEQLTDKYKYDVIVSNTFTTNKEMKPYFDMVDQINLHRCERKEQNSLIRINVIHLENDFGSTHNVPPETIEKMRARWEPLRLKQRLEF